MSAPLAPKDMHSSRRGLNCVNVSKIHHKKEKKMESAHRRQRLSETDSELKELDNGEAFVLTPAVDSQPPQTCTMLREQ